MQPDDNMLPLVSDFFPIEDENNIFFLFPLIFDVLLLNFYFPHSSIEL